MFKFFKFWGLNKLIKTILRTQNHLFCIYKADGVGGGVTDSLSRSC